MQVPVIAESGPYFQEASVETPSIEVPGSWLGQMFIDQILLARVRLCSDIRVGDGAK